MARKLFRVGTINGRARVQIRFMSTGTVRIYVDGKETDLIDLGVESLSELKETIKQLRKHWYKLVVWD